jgi:hypothetical protein
MKNKHKKKIKRIAHRGHNQLLGGKQKADRLRCAAADMRIRRGLCRCADDERYYTDAASAAKDESPPVTCSVCGLAQLRVKIITGKPPSEDQQLAFKNLLK